MAIKKKKINISFFKSIPEVDAIIYFDNDVELLKKWILSPIGLKSTIVRNPFQLIINFKVIIFFIKNIKLIIGKNFIRRAWFTYEKSLIKVYNPKIVITTIDNANFVSELSKIDKGRSYFAIQNGARFDYDVKNIQKSVFKEIDKKSFIYFIWSEYEKTVFTKHSDYKCHFISVGSLRQSISEHYPTKLVELNNKKFDICMASSVFGLRNYDIPRAVYGEKVVDDEWNIMNAIIAKYLKRYIKEKNKSLIVVLRGQRDYEINMYESIFSGTKNVFLMPRGFPASNTNAYFNTYAAVKKSEVIVSMASSVTLEALNYGKKILQVDYSLGKQYFTNYVDGLWQLTENTYEAFSNRLNQILQLDINEYNNNIKEYKNHVMKIDSVEPTYLKIQKEINKII